MSNHLDAGNVIHIIGGDEADNQDGEGLGEPSQIPTRGSCSFALVENDRSYKFRHCKAYYTEAGCLFRDNCIYIHDENAKARESLAVSVAPGSGGGYWNVTATGNDGGPAAPLPQAPPPQAPPLATLPTQPLAAAIETAKLSLAQQPLLAKIVSSATVKPLYWRTRICSRWEYSGYCQFGSKCIFAHGDAELQRRGSRPVDGEANQQAMVQNLAVNQRAVVQNLAAPSGPLTDHAVTAPAADVGGSRQMSCSMQGPIPSQNAWKVPKKLIGIYADWIDDLEL